MIRSDNRNLFYILCWYLLVGIASWLLFDFLRWTQHDTPSFILGAKYLFGMEGGEVIQQRITKPLPLLFPGLLDYLFSAPQALIIVLQNTVLYLLSGILMYRLVKTVSGNSDEATMGALMLAGCQPIAIFSLFVLSDVWGYCAVLLVMWMAVRAIKDGKAGAKKWLLIGFVAAMGTLSKESALVGFAFAGMLLLVSSIGWSARFRYGSALLIGFFVPVVLVQLAIWEMYGISILHRVAITHQYTIEYSAGINYLKQIYRMLDVYWWFVAGGISVLIFIKGLLQRPEMKALLVTAALFLMVSPFFSGYLVDRILFMAGPVFLLLALPVFRYLGRWTVPLVLAGGALNILVAWAIYRFQSEGLLLKVSVVFLIVFLAAIVYTRKVNSSGTEHSG